MEHFLAYRKAKLSDQEDLIARAQQPLDAIEAKAILNTLREDHKGEWNEQVESVTLEGLRAKFSQNPRLLDFLRSTQNLQIGESSTNERWGTGLDLSDPDALDTSKWNSSGNLLGRCLMQVREELCHRT